jgi:CO/xanthine dehydrogenase Mo-binding subunit
MIPPTPTIANAIQNAIGVRLDKVPMNPEAVLNALKAMGNNR